MKRTKARAECLHGIFVSAIEGGGCGTDSWAYIWDYSWSLGAPAYVPDIYGFHAVVVEHEAWEEAMEEVVASLAWPWTSRLGSTVSPTADRVKALLQEKGEWHVVNIDTIAKGLRIIREKSPKELHLNERLVREIRRYDRSNGEDADLDVIGYDAIMQAALFGEVVFG